VVFALARGRRADPLPWLLWWVAVSLALRCVFESVMVSYYLWPVLQVTLIVAVRRWSRLIVTSLLTSAITFGSQVQSSGPWLWWSLMTAGLALTLLCAWGDGPGTGDQPVPAGQVPATLTGSLDGG
jgi:hypothetical protein